MVSTQPIHGMLYSMLTEMVSTLTQTQSTKDYGEIWMNSDIQLQLQMVTMQLIQESQIPMAMASVMAQNTSVYSTSSLLCGAITQISMITSMFVAMPQDQLRMRHTSHHLELTVEQTQPTRIQMGMECLMAGKLNIGDGLVLHSLVLTTGQWILTILMTQIGMLTEMD